MRQRKNGKSTAAATAAYRRYLSSSPAATLHGKTQGFVFQFPPHASPMQDSYNHYNAFRNITSQTCTYLRIWQDQMTRIMQLFRCDLQPQIAKHPIITHGQSYLKQLEATIAMRQRKKINRRSHNGRTQEI